MNIYDIINRARSLREEYRLDSVTPERLGALHEDTLTYINQYQLLASSPAIHKTFVSVSAMQGSASPTSDLTGRPLKAGQLVVIVPSDQTDSTAGDVYRYDGPSGSTSKWTFVAKLGAVPADSELSATSTNPPQNRAVTEKLTELESKTNEIDFNKANIKAGKNKLNPLSCKPNTYIKAENGAEGILDGCFATWYIPVDGQNLYCNNPSDKGAIIGWAAYDENKNFTHGDSFDRYRYTYQDGDVYVRFSLSTLENAQIETGIAATEYEPFNPVAGWGIEDLKEQVFKLTFDGEYVDSELDTMLTPGIYRRDLSGGANRPAIVFVTAHSAGMQQWLFTIETAGKKKISWRRYSTYTSAWTEWENLYDIVASNLENVIYLRNGKASIKAGKNLLNPESCLADTYIESTNGATGTMTGVYASDYIAVNGNNLVLNNPNLLGYSIGWAAYDAEKNYTHGTNSPRQRYTYQEGDVYVRFSLSTLENTQVEIGTASTEYEPFNPVAGWGISELEENKLDKQDFTSVIEGWETIPTRLLEMVKIEGNLTQTLLEIKDGHYISGIDENGYLKYTSNTSYKTFLLPVDGTSTYEFDYVRFAVLMETREKAIDGASLIDSAYRIDSTGANYIAISINVETYPLATFRVGIGEIQEKPEYHIPNLVLEDESVSIDMVDFSEPNKNRFNINDKDCVLGYYLAANKLQVSDAYNVTGYIKVEPSTTYQCSCDGDKVYGEYLARFVCQYDENGEYIEGADLQPSTSTNQFTTGANTHYVRISVRTPYWEKYQVEEGEYPTSWEKYRLVIDKSALPNNKEKAFTRLHNSADLTNGQTLTLPQNFVRKNIAFSVKIHRDSLTGLDVLMGLGYNAYTGGWLELTDTKLKVHNYVQADVVAEEYDHNLTLGNDIVILFDGEIKNATIKIISDGQIFSQEINRDSYFAGAGFVTNLGADAIYAEMSVMPKDINQKTWLYGDSYLGYLNSERWLTYMLEWGFNSWMSDSRPGGNSAEGFVSMTTDMGIGKPKYILWLNGMNDGGDADANTPSTIWMSNMEKVVKLAKDVELILATIPSVPTINHEAKNAWVRNSGYRYIDFANAVGADANGTWKNGMLHADGVHPTTLGARALASQVLIDFPEIMVKS